MNDHQLLIALAEVNAEFGEDQPAADLDARSTRLNAAAERRWGAPVVDELARLVGDCAMTGDEFVSWARGELGAAWLRARVR